MPRIVVSEPARRDITEILAWSVKNFGERSAERYQALFASALDLLKGDPNPTGSRSHPDIPEGFRIYHLQYRAKAAESALGIVKAPRHFIVFRLIPNDRLEIVRLLHDSMDFQRHI